MDAIMSNFILTIIGMGVGSIVTLIGAFGKCFLKSRCTNIKCCCLSCDRDLMPVESDIYHDASSTPTNKI